MQYFYYATPHGPLTIASNERGVCRIAFGKHELSGTCAPSAATNAAATQLQEYFAGKRFAFEADLGLEGSEFQCLVWEYVRTIPFGSTNTVADVARAIGHAKAWRSVGSALARNPVRLIVPDHRVVSATGQALGTGAQAQLRRALLAHEKRYMP